MTLSSRGYHLVYGGATVGLMGTLADSALESGTHVTGAIPECLVEMEVAHEELTESHVVQSMHERKQIMADKSDAFVLLPGGVGSLEEIFEIITWKQLRLHTKPIAILNAHGYFDKLLEFLADGVAHDFMRSHVIESLIVESEIEALFDRIGFELGAI